MGSIEILFIGVGLSMDALAVAICKGLAMRSPKWSQAMSVGLYFGIFQAGMPLLGYLLGVQFKDIIASVDHWIAFVLLGIIGCNMIRESKEEEEACEDASVSFRNMILLAIATSIDALAIGITFAFLSVQIVPAAVMIGTTTFVLSMLGVKLGGIFGAKFKNHAEMAGGIILILLGIKILLEHLGIL